MEARAIASRVHKFCNMSPATVGELKEKFNDRVKADDAFWEKKRDSVQAVLIELNEVVKLQIDKATLPTSREGWIIWKTEEELNVRGEIPEIIYF